VSVTFIMSVRLSAHIIASSTRRISRTLILGAFMKICHAISPTFPHILSSIISLVLLIWSCTICACGTVL